MGRIWFSVMFIAGLLLVTPATAQVDTTLLRWYPLDQGNYWQYSYYFADWRVPEFDSGHFSLEVVGDTVMPNGKKYAVLERRELPSGGPSYIYQRVDSLTGNVYQYCADVPGGEALLDSLAAQIDDSIRAVRDAPCVSQPEWLTVCMNVYEDSLFGHPFMLKDFERFGFFPTFQYTLVKGLGYKHGHMAEEWSYSEGLVYARIRGQEYGEPVKIIQDGPPDNSSFRLSQNFPNPFNSRTRIDYYLPRSEPVQIVVYDLLGRFKQVIFSGRQPAGDHFIIWDAADVPSGIYFYTLITPTFRETRQCIVLR